MPQLGGEGTWGATLGQCSWTQTGALDWAAKVQGQVWHGILESWLHSLFNAIVGCALLPCRE